MFKVNMRKFILTLIFLTIPIALYSQPMPAMSAGIPVNSFTNAAIVDSTNGVAFALPSANANTLTWQISYGVAPGAINIVLQTSQDNSAWFTVDTTTAVSGEIRNYGPTSALFVRARIVSHAGGSGLTVTFTIGRTIGVSLTLPAAFTTNNIGATVVPGVGIQNLTPAAPGAQQNSPLFYLQGSGWKTNATAESQTVKFGIQARPTQGTSAPGFVFHFLSNVNDTGWNTLFTTNENGVFTSTGPIAVSALSYFSITSRSSILSPADNEIQLTNSNNNGFSRLLYGPEASANTSVRLQKSVTGIANAVATPVLTVTIPNAAHSASLSVRLTGSLGAGGAIGANEATGVNNYNIAIARTSGVATVAVASSAYGTANASVAGGATITVTAAVSGMTGGVGATQTFTINVTITRGSGSSTNHTCLVIVEIHNANGTGITVS